MSKDHEPIDMSDEENEKAFLKDMAVWAEKMANDGEMKEQAYVDVVSVPPIRYGTWSP